MSSRRQKVFCENRTLRESSMGRIWFQRLPKRETRRLKPPTRPFLVAQLKPCPPEFPCLLGRGPGRRAGDQKLETRNRKLETQAPPTALPGSPESCPAAASPGCHCPASGRQR